MAGQIDLEKPPYILGFDIGGTKTALILGTLDAKILRRTEFPTPVRDPFESAMVKIEHAAGEFIHAWVREGREAPKAISVAVGGPLDIEKGILFSPPHLIHWGEAHLKSSLEGYFNIPVFVEHDGNAGALAEFTFGAGRGTRNLVFITMGTGLGAGIICNGEIYHGASDAAGEVGHVRIADDGPEEYGKAGSWEGYCSGAGIVKYARQKSPEIWGVQTTTHDIVEKALNGDPQAVEVITEVGRWLGKGLAMLVDVLNPDRIVIGTLGVVLGDLVLGPAREVVHKEALQVTSRVCQIVPASLGSSLMDIGCLMAAIDAHRTGKLNL